jgi:type IV pilus assembly protein PilC
MAQNILADRGLIPAGVTEAKASQSQGAAFSSIDEKLSTVRTPELILFTKQFRTLLQAGVPILQLLQVLENQSPNKKLKKIAAAMSADIKEGASLYDAFRKHKTFSHLYCSMVRAGESSGALPEVLSRLTYIIEHENRVKSDIKSALQYPATVVIALAGAFFFLLTVGVPKFASVFQSAKLELPWPTLVCMMLNH